MKRELTSTNIAEQANAICLALGPDATVNALRIESPGRYTSSFFRIASPEFAPAELTAYVAMDGSDRLMIDVGWPNTHDGIMVLSSRYVRDDIADDLGGAPKTIGMKFTKDPLIIASDIRNRLLPQVMKFLPLVVAGNQEWARKDRENRQSYNEILLSMGHDPAYIDSYNAAHNSNHMGAYPLKYTGYKGGNRVELSISSTGHTTMIVAYSDPKGALEALNSIK